MARPRKRINNTPYPDYVIDAVARTFYPNLLEDWQNENARSYNKEFYTVIDKNEDTIKIHTNS